MRVLVVNAGSTSVKLRLVEADDTVSRRENLGPPDGTLEAEVDRFLTEAGSIDAIGHRVVHGGPHHHEPVLVDDATREELESLCALAPLHNPPALQAVDALRRAAPAIPSVACFDSAFHAGMPEESRRYALPADWVQRWQLRRYGFHGLSCEWSLRRASAMLGSEPGRLRLVVCHLGGGASVTAIAGGRSVDTTMGFTPTEGLVMATRSGDVDPGLIAWLAEKGLSGEELMDGLEHRSGLLGLTGGRTGDMKEILDARAGGDAVAAGAVAVYIHRLRAEISAMATSAGGLDALVFTGGVGEKGTPVREETCRGLEWLGVAIDPSLNAGVTGDDADISAAGAAVRTLVVQAREEVVVADHCREVLASGQGTRSSCPA